MYIVLTIGVIYLEQRARAPNTVTLQDIERYLAQTAEKGLNENTIKAYRRCLVKFYRFLPPDKRIEPGSVGAWREELKAEYAPRSINVCLSAVNSFMEYMNLHAYQLQSRLKPDEGETLPELTRAEYLRMLEHAKSDRNERAYLLTKVFACTGLTVQELPKLTLEAAKAGVVERHAGLPAKLPGCLRSELLSYAQRRAIDSGPLFVTRSGRALNRTEVTGTIQRLACAAKIEPGKGNPRCLRKLYLNAQHEIWRSLLPLAEQSHERLIETEQLAVGWKEEM